jgi:hypothetical protein
MVATGLTAFPNPAEFHRLVLSHPFWFWQRTASGEVLQMFKAIPCALHVLCQGAVAQRKFVDRI